MPNPISSIVVAGKMSQCILMFFRLGLCGGRYQGFLKAKVTDPGVGWRILTIVALSGYLLGAF